MSNVKWLNKSYGEYKKGCKPNTNDSTTVSIKKPFRHTREDGNRPQPTMQTRSRGSPDCIRINNDQEANALRSLGWTQQDIQRARNEQPQEAEEEASQDDNALDAAASAISAVAMIEY